jgi:nucleotide-binding universal stress UspA family protein
VPGILVLLVHTTVTHNRPLLIGYDGSAEAGDAIDVAAALLKPTDAVVLNVAPRLTVGESLVTVGVPVSGDAAFEGVNRADAARRADAGARLARAAGLRAEARVCVAAPRWEGIVETARDIDAAVIVLGSRRRRNLSHDVAQHSERPLLTVPGRAGGRVGEGPILIAYEGSEAARRAMATARGLVRRQEAVVLEAGTEAGVELAHGVGFRSVAPRTWKAAADVADEIDAGVVVVGSQPAHAERPVLVVPPSRA